jgi:hypothetical protein
MQYTREEKSGFLRQCVAGLSPAHGQIIDLVYYHEKSVSEVAEILAIPEATVKTRMFYARKRLGDLVIAAQSSSASENIRDAAGPKHSLSMRQEAFPRSGHAQSRADEVIE